MGAKLTIQSSKRSIISSANPKKPTRRFVLSGLKIQEPSQSNLLSKVKSAAKTTKNQNSTLQKPQTFSLAFRVKDKSPFKETTLNLNKEVNGPSPTMSLRKLKTEEKVSPKIDPKSHLRSEYSITGSNTQ